MVSKAFVKPVKGKNEVYYKLYSAYNKKLKGLPGTVISKKALLSCRFSLIANKPILTT
ncbi:hypothetical protein HMPREF0519_0866 [Lentilactobacillus hilgardii DSM 20176 = ATCC 8290]|uniref:Uncharacterized protein n=1 Tax=Lentilactobacillus hilgardii (strain ATCC 8290 / DSM 20176 / CCUG 30140 / JCM 1155 / KCTC 3500 / NBRC 15886 / NCIMB 8040 / NRRL B-1843 / 9) TaxID=1423757 RepID=C0XI05_LENH9|nr:hypothetical protein HMPREF0519_0866 [Lentilactobacillus hilgardii DSM 20176 = ATCC 8290]